MSRKISPKQHQNFNISKVGNTEECQKVNNGEILAILGSQMIGLLTFHPGPVN